MSVEAGRDRFRGRAKVARRPGVEPLEGRQLLATGAPNLAMVAATTADSKSVAIAYDVQGEVSQPIDFSVYRSADGRLDASDIWAGTATVAPPGSGAPTLDMAGQPALATGPHALTITVPGGLPPDPHHPFVIVAADSGHALAESDEGDNAASFRTRTVGIITHGGMQPSKWKAGPPWEHRMAASLAAQGYDAVIPFNWVSQSSHPGAVPKQAMRLENMVLQAASQFPAGDVVDLHFIGHSEGAIIDSLAIQRLQADAPPAVQAGYIKQTMLDPHSANNGVHGKQYSTSGGLLGYVAKMTINTYQARADDPAPFVPANVDDAEVFYQHTPVSVTYGSNRGTYNLWGQVPVRGDAHYFNLTAPGVSHSGKFGVQDWYQINVVPALGDGAPFLQSSILTGSLQGAPEPADVHSRSTADTRRPAFEGTAAPNATVELFAAKGRTDAISRIGLAAADEQGHWTVRSRPLTDGRYRVIAMSNIPANSDHPRIVMRPTVWLGQVTVHGRRSRS